MGETVLLVAVLLLALYGCVELMRELVTRLMAPLALGNPGFGHSCQWSSRRYRVCYSFGDGGMPLGRKRRTRRVWLLDMDWMRKHAG